jgi:hypothetical protein
MEVLRVPETLRKPVTMRAQKIDGTTSVRPTPNPSTSTTQSTGNSQNMTVINSQAPRLFAGDTRNLLSIAIERIQLNRQDDENIIQLQQTFGLLLVMFHLYLEEQPLHNDAIAKFFGKDYKYVRKLVKPLVGRDLVVEYQTRNKIGNGNKWNYKFSDQLVEDLIAMRPASRR